jgi:hypothetical protein
MKKGTLIKKKGKGRNKEKKPSQPKDNVGELRRETRVDND